MIDKKIAITGHTRGFGKFLYDTLIEDNLVMGFSKSTGTDITKRSDRKQMIESISNCDVFINCAQSGFSQTDVLYEVFKEWQDQKKMIINIGSNARDFTSRDRPYKYSVEKSALNLASKQLGRCGICRVSTVDFGYLVRPTGEEDRSIITYEEAYSYVENILASFGKSYRVLEVLIAHE